MKELKTLEDLLVHCVADLFSAENQILQALPKMQEAATASELKEGFAQHLTETEGHVKRLEQIVNSFHPKVDTNVVCKGMEGLLKEGAEVLEMEGDSDVKDSALIGAAGKVEHYEIASYTDAAMLAKKLKMNDVAELLEQTLAEEGAMAKKLEMTAEAMASVEAELES